MRNFLLLTLAGCFYMLFAAGCQDSSASKEYPVDNNNPLDGAWELVYVEDTSASGEKSIRESDEPIQLKVFSDNHFALVHLNQEGRYVFASSGTYELDGNRYIEKHLYGSNPILEKTSSVTMIWEYEMEGDMLVISGPQSCVDAEGNDIMTEIMGSTTFAVEKRRRAQ